ncbi:MAG: DNA-binding protein, partial [Alphaproteobacteria bacterium]|nr:DNA-binding protein [Alphaproteobacteria bacterium]
LARAGAALAAGHAVILDAVFATTAERQAAEDIARQMGVAFHGLWLAADPGILMARVARRRNDASDADVAVVERQLSYDLGAMTWQRLEAGSGAADVLGRARAALNAKGALAPEAPMMPSPAV